MENLRGQIDYEVRTALLDLQAAADQVEVAQNSVDLANQTLTQARDRFAAGVADNLEVVQAQESVARPTKIILPASMLTTWPKSNWRALSDMRKKA